ncbi:hypothetical protein EST38_g12290, partial [Candolleomyces aberdarensis]
DDVYDGYFIPKGTIVFGNAWGIMHDPDVFEDPMAFKPERFLRDGKPNPDILDPMIATFGFGRRICPGRLLAVETLYSIISSTLAMYNILPPKDEQGNPVKVEARLSGGAMIAIAGLGIEIIYGFEFKAAGDALIQDVIAVAAAFKAAGVRGRFWVEILLVLKYVPSWMPGAGFHRWAIEHREASRRVLNNPFQEVYEAHAKHEAKKCMATSLIDRLPAGDTAEREEATIIARNVTAQTHLGAVETTHSAAMAFLMAMAVYPEIQKAAQDELDRVVGHGVIPDFTHKPELPCVDAMLKELLRWHQVVPLAIPHLVMEDNIYDGFFIPKGTVVFGNA